MMRPESSFIEFEEIASGVAIAASVSEIAEGVPSASCTRQVLEIAAGSQAAMACEA